MQLLRQGAKPVQVVSMKQSVLQSDKLDAASTL